MGWGSRPVIWTMAVVAVASLSAGPADRARAAEVEVLRNGGFEQAAENRPAEWTPNGPVAIAAEARTGRFAVRLGSGGRLLQCFPLEGGVVYQAGVWARGRGKLTLAFYEYRDGPGQNYAGGADSRPLDLGASWQRYELVYSQGPNEKHLKGLCFALAAGSEPAEVFVDDASVVKTPLPTRPTNLLKNPDFHDADGDGLPEDWQAERRRLTLQPLPDGRRAVRCAATLFSADYLPAPDFKDWWHWPRWGQPHGSGWPALPRPLGGVYTVLLQSAPVAVDPGKRYDVDLLLREHEVWGEFIGVRWFDAQRRPLEEFEERLGYYHMLGHTGDWVRYVGRTTSPAKARFAAVVVGAKLSSGAVWVAQPALVFGLGAPYRHQPREDWLPASRRQGVPQTDLSLPADWPAPPPARPGVQVSPSKVVIGLANGVGLELLMQDKRLRGIGTVTCGRTLLRSPQAPPLAPVVETIPMRLYTECLYEGWEETRDGLVIRSTLRTTDGEQDALEWLVAPDAQTVGGRAYVGLRYAFRFASRSVRCLRLMDRATWEPAGHAVGTQVGQELLLVSRSSTYCLQSAYRFVEADSFDYLTSRAGTILSFLDKYHTTLLMRAATPDFIILQDTFLFPEVGQARTPWKHVLLCPQPGDADDWARVRDELYARYRRQVGAPAERPVEPACMILGWGGLRGVGPLRLDKKDPTRPEYYQWVAGQAVPALAALGFKRLMIVLGMSPLNWPAEDINTLCPEYEKPFKRLCDEARRHGLSVIIWYGTAQNLDKAAVWKAHPDYILWGPDGQRARAYYSPWGWPGNLASGFFQHTLQGLRDLKERTGTAGLWLDSYSSATHLLETARPADAVRQADAFLPWLAEIEKMGYYTYAEGRPTAIGIVSESGWQPPADWSRFRPETYYKEGLYLQQPYGSSDHGRFLADPDKRHYYRFLANRCCPILDMGHFGDDQAAIQRIAQANRDFNAVSDLMAVRRLHGQRAVEWLSEKGRAMFVFEPIDYAVPAGLILRDVTTPGDIAVPADRRVRLEAYHTYRLTPR